MESHADLPASPSLVNCSICNATVQSDVKFCPSCSYPIGGSEEEQSRFRMGIVRNKQMIKDAKEKIQTAKIIMYVLAGITLITGIYQGFNDDNMAGMIVNGVLCILYLAMAGWADNNPFGATLVVFILYITVNLLNAFFAPETLFQGILLKIFVIAALIKGITSAKQAQDSLEMLEKTKTATNRDR